MGDLHRALCTFPGFHGYHHWSSLPEAFTGIEDKTGLKTLETQ